MSDNDAWFAAKRYGYGAGLPIRWQGWAVLAGFIAVLIGAQVALARGHWVGFAVVVALDVAILVAVAAPRTVGGWRWRSGDGQ